MKPGPIKRVVRKDKIVPRCICCRQDFPGDFPLGGTIIVEFGYGSRYDFSAGEEMPDRPSRLASADLIEGFICDDCFAKRHQCFNGFSVVETVEVVETVKQSVVVDER